MTPLSRYVVETLVTLLAVVALCVVLLSALRRVGVGKLGGPLELLARLPLEGRRAVYLVRAGETVYVLAASENALAKLGEMPRALLPNEPAAELVSFSQVLKRAVGMKAASPAKPRDDADGAANQEPPP
ncbi:MAG TPA: flagellar biosynthetic protein FliO [Polyangiaceae bacterium]|nr:flagellar biosynthetic protein FliO [Polyangiaceae bacterium]